MKNKGLILIIIILITGAFLIGLYFGNGKSDKPSQEKISATDTSDQKTEQSEKKILFWTCSMHPQIHQPQKGLCPICSMELIPVYADENSNQDESESSKGDLTLSDKAKKLAEVEVAPVIRKDVEREIKLVGKIKNDETRQRYITARVGGRIDQLYIDYTGKYVNKGDPMASIYSPELYSAQQELFQSKKAVDMLKNSEMSSLKESSEATLHAVREKLRLMGLSKTQIEDIEKSKKIQDHITIDAPVSGVVVEKDVSEGMYVEIGDKIFSVADLSEVWAELNVYESDLAWLKKNQEVDLTAQAYPDEIFKGKVAFINPILDDMTRTVMARVVVPNKEGKLKPEMFVNANIKVKLESKEKPLVIPASAPLITGKRAIVYVQLPDSKGSYEGREIVLGDKAGDYYIVKEGLSEGELVVVKGNFKIDSAVQLLAKPSMMSPEDGVPAPIADIHAGMDMTEDTPVKENKIIKKSNEFQNQFDKVIKDYLSLSKALSKDDMKNAKSDSANLLNSLKAVDMKLLDADTHIIWMTEYDPLTKSSEQISKAEKIEQIRKKFNDLSQSLTKVIEKVGVSKNKLYNIHCPMAFDGKGADWIQDNENVENPYMGQEMLTCGEVVKVYSPIK